MDEERRAFYRVLLRAPLSCLAVGADGSAQLVRMETIDLSAGGGKALCSSPLPEGTPLRLVLSLGRGSEPLRLDARVARLECPGREPEQGVRMAIEFTPLSNAAEQRLMRIVFDQERVHAGRHTHVRSSVWHPIRLRREGLEYAGHAEALSTDDVQVVTQAPLAEGERVGVAMAYAPVGLELEAEATVTEVRREGAAVHATVTFDGVDRLTHSRLLRVLIEDERRTVAGPD
jgi:hypothetical protein